MGSKPGPAALHKHLVRQSKRAEKHRQNSDASQALQTKKAQPRYTCVWGGRERDQGDAEQDLTGAWSPLPHSAPHLPLDVLQEVLVALQEAEVLELSVVPLRLDKPPLLDVHHLPEAICTERTRLMGQQDPALPPPPTPITLEDISDHPSHFLSCQCSHLDMLLGHIHWKPRARESPVHPTGHPCCSLCHESLSTMGMLVCQALKCQLLGNSCLNLQAKGIQGKVFQRHRPSTGGIFEKKGHMHIWKSAMSTSLKSSKGF